MLNYILDFIQISDVKNMYNHVLSWGEIPNTNHIMHAISYDMILKGAY